MKTYTEDVGIISMRDSYSTPYVVKYFKDKKEVLIRGDGRPDQGRLLAVGFKNLTEKQASAMELGLRILAYLETGTYPSLESTRIEKQPGATLNFNS